MILFIQIFKQANLIYSIVLEVRMVVTFEVWVVTGRRYKGTAGVLEMFCFQTWALIPQVFSTCKKFTNPC